jgi:predicted nucleic acid-binding protein
LENRETIAKIENGSLESYTCETNMAELYYKTCENLGSDVAELRTTTIRESNIEIHPVDEILTERAGSLKCKYRGKISLADAYILATSMEFRCRLITTDPILKELGSVPTSLLSLR